MMIPEILATLFFVLLILPLMLWVGIGMWMCVIDLFKKGE